MKKFFIATILAVAAVLPASAQVRSLDMKANLRSDFGLGIGVTFQLPRNFEFAPSLNYYFNDNNTLTIDGDFRYRFELPRNFSLYPILGPVFFHADDYNKLGVDIGLGFAYDINSHWAIGAEAQIPICRRLGRCVSVVLRFLQILRDNENLHFRRIFPQPGRP